ncbi:MAG: PH domain-containing protein [Phycisphaerae bacterium]|nr:PH domain-containing protein [Phycisphaerae bacterium]
MRVRIDLSARRSSRQSAQRLMHASCGQTPGAGADARPIPALSDLLPANLLSGDEIVILAMKPSLWFVLFVSARWILAMAVLLVLVGNWGHRFPLLDRPVVLQGAVAVAAARLGFALLQWVSRLYVLTNRRILRLMGILNIDLFECQLTRIQNTYLTMSWYERLVRLGSISFATAGTGGVEASWWYVNHPLEVHERIRAAIHRARGPANGV